MCLGMERTHEWGGQLELRALSQALRCTIVVHTAGQPPLRLEGSGGTRELELHVSYHRTQYMLGEHYNSVVEGTAGAGAGGGAAGGDDGWTTV